MIAFVDPLIASPLFNIASIAVFLVLFGTIAEPRRQQAMVVILGVAAGVYIDGGMGWINIAFTIAIGYCAYRGLRSYSWLGMGWLLHTGIDILQHRAGLPIWEVLPHSSFGCAVVDPVIALWCFASGPALNDWWRRRSGASNSRE